MPFLDSDVTGGRVRHKRSRVAGETPGAGVLRQGEIAVNTADGVAFVGKTDGTASTLPTATGISKIVALTQAQYDAIAVKDPATLYVVT